jgi:mono/diheme cytochrome c family protein
MSQRTVAIAIFAIILVGVIAVSLAGGRRAQPVAPSDPALANITGPDADNPQLVNLGREVYATYCASCHGRNLEGQPGWQSALPGGGRLAPPHDASGHTWHHPDQLLFEITKNGGQASSPPGYINNMPGFAASLSDTQIWASLAYIKSTWPADVRAAQEQANSDAAP